MTPSLGFYHSCLAALVACQAPAAVALQWEPVEPPPEPPAPPPHWRDNRTAPSASPGWNRLNPSDPQSPGLASAPALPLWELAPTNAAPHGPSSLQWEAVAPNQEIAAPTAEATALAAPTSQAEVQELLSSLWPSAIDYQPHSRLGAKFPTAFVLPLGELLFSAYQISPLAGGGEAGGTGNQNFVAQVDLGLVEGLQISAFFTDSDDPLFAQPEGLSPNPANIWRTYGIAAQWQFVQEKNWGAAFTGSLENFFVESGGCRSSGGGVCSPNIFNTSGQVVSTNNLVGSLGMPISWRPTPSLELTVSPGVSFLPSSQGAGQGGAGTFFGTNVTLTAGALWQPIPQLGIYGSALVPLGPGTNTFDTALEFSRAPIFSGGLRYALNPRIGFELALTNGFGASPATSVLTLPSSNQALWMAQWSYIPGAPDSPNLPFNTRTRSLSLGGLTVGTAIIPPNNTANAWLSVDSQGSLFGQIAYSASNDFQLSLATSLYNNVGTDSAFSANYVGKNGVTSVRAGGKAVLFHQLRGAPFSLSASASFGQDRISNYLFGDVIATWEANNWLALNLNPKLVWAGNGQPFSVGLSANLQLGESFQLIPEVNIGTNESSGTNATLAIRWLANRTTAVDLFVSNTAGPIDVGQLLENVDEIRVGTRLTVQF